jgi:hypothetical protein
MPGMNKGFKPCAECPSPARCKAAGQCARQASGNIREKPPQPTPVRG